MDPVQCSRSKVVLMARAVTLLLYHIARSDRYRKTLRHISTRGPGSRTSGVIRRKSNLARYVKVSALEPRGTARTLLAAHFLPPVKSGHVPIPCVLLSFHQRNRMSENSYANADAVVFSLLFNDIVFSMPMANETSYRKICYEKMDIEIAKY